MVHNDCAYQYLDEALQRQGLDKVLEGGFKETWIKEGYKYQVRAHPANPEFTESKQIYRVARQVNPVNNTGWQYLGSNGVWYQERFLKLNDFAAKLTHIPVP